LVLLLPAYASAGFDLYGFQQGMTKRDVEKLAASRSYKVQIFQHWWQIWTSQSEYILLNFCADDRLYWGSNDIKGGYINYIRMLEQYTNAGYTITNSDPQTFLASEGLQYGSLNIDLARPGDGYYVTLIATGNDREPSVSIQHIRTAVERCPEFTK